MKRIIIAGLLFASLGAYAAGKLQNSDFATGADIVSAGGSLSQLLNTSKIWDSTNNQLLDTTIAGKQPAGNYITSLTGEVTATGPGAAAATITNSAVTNAKLANMAAGTLKGNNTGSPAAPLDLTGTQATALLDNFVGDSGSGGTKGLVPAPAAGDAAAGKVLKADGTWGSAGTTSPLTTKGDLYTYSTVNTRLPVGTNNQILVPDSAQTTGLSWVTTLPTAAVPGFTGGDVTSSAGSLALTIGNSTVTNAKLANMAANTFKANNTASPAAPSDITGTQATALLDTFTSALKGLAPASGGGTSNFLRADGTWAAPGGSGAADVVVKSITQASHGFSVGQIVYFNGTSYALARANADSTSEVLGVVTEVTDINNFKLSMTGYVSGLSGLVAGTTYYLSDTVAGALTATAPTAGPSVNKPVLVAISASTAYVLQSRGYVIGPASVPTLVMSDWTDYTLTVGATVSAPTFGTLAINKARYRRVGDSMEIDYTLRQTSAGTAGSGVYKFPLPSGYQIDNTKVVVDTIYGSQVGGFEFSNNSNANGATSAPGYVFTYDTTSLAAAWLQTAGTMGILQNGVGDASNTNLVWRFHAFVPIAGWTATSSGQVAAARAEIAVDSGNGYGSTNTKFRRFSNIRKNNGSDITYADSATDGASFTINTAGLYTISYNDGNTGSPVDFGVSVNPASGTASINGLSYANGFRSMVTSAAAAYVGFTGWTGYLAAGDVVRANGGGTLANFTDSRCSFTITKVSN